MTLHLPLTALLLLAGAAGAATPARIPEAAAAYVQAQAQATGFMGTVLITQRGRTLYAGTAGQANLELGARVTPDTLFRIASISKSFTAAAILKLQDQGKLNVGDRLSRFLPAYPHAQEITLHQLLTHTAGVADYTDRDAFATFKALPHTLDALIARFAGQPLNFAPGTKFQYSNAGYVLLSRVVEVASGQPYADFLRQQVLAPAGLKLTDYDAPQPLRAGRASGYDFDGTTYTNADHVDASVASGAGALISTARELDAWIHALQGGRVLSKAATAQMFTPAVPVAPGQDSRYGYGWLITPASGAEPARTEHNGNIDGYMALLRTYPAEDLTITVLSNVSTAPVGLMADDLAALVHGQPYTLPVKPRVVSVPAAVLDRYVGTYAFADGQQFEVRRQGAGLRVTVSDQIFPLIAVAPDRFLLQAVGAELVFGPVTGGRPSR
ncbi:serine hydrolase [Deinococcus multiflagellatus]|uniref:Serine hydrolase n=1 Tax=Deinococcus multiflagellatus TaxID=1656887 RepID=A0ABW1ZDM2_9DEIO